ncbi:unnamed protein product, partial [Dracunculus medinensis]|uniref:mRNA-decapping enzyme 2 n=1 Tax=Dracunculus medinensis TaxID=318479 RepID=A0A0N4U3I3_DRAME
RSNPIRLLFELELAHWYYLDFLSLKSSDNSIYPNLKFTEFTRLKFYLFIKNCNNEYKRGIPTAGAILLDKSLDHVVLVQGYYSHSWGFPKGKQNKAESEEDCAKREVREEVGYDIAEKISPNLFIEKLLGMTRARLYIITDVPVEYQFVPEARHEIKKIQWFRVSDLPLDRFNDTSCRASGLSYRNFYTVLPFVADLRRSIDRLRKEV